MIHCGLASSDAWRGLARYLSGALAMTAFDMPGHGRSADWDARGEYQDNTTQIAAAFLDGPTDVIGHSFGATVALRLAIEHPQLVRSLTLTEPVLFAVALADDAGDISDDLQQAVGFGGALGRDEYVEAARQFTATWGDGTAFSDLPKTHQQNLASQMPLIAATEEALFDDAGNLLRPDRLARVNMPVLIIEGSESPKVMCTICQGLGHRLLTSERAIIAGTGHMVPLTHASAVSAEIIQMLKKT